jgi:3-deoxy-D-manno-octulosonic-acid transferase
VLAVCLLPVALLALAFRRDWRTGLGERLGAVPPTQEGRPAIWIHGASVGEIVALAPVVRALRAELPDHRLVVSTLTETGRAVAAERIPEADACVLFPLDLRWCVERAVRAVRPRLVLFSETELWPSFLAALARRGIPSVMVSGRVSPRAAARYRRWRFLFAPGLASVRWLAVQSLDSARLLRELGAPAGRVVVAGSLKTVPASDAPSGATLEKLGVAGSPVLVAGSTHPGEEAMLLDAWQAIVAEVPDARLVLAPRRPDRFEEVAAWLRELHAAFVRRSDLVRRGERAWPADAPILLLDSLGELAGLYAGARAAFVGGTLVPVGGHNVLEPAAHGVPVVFGPHVGTTAAAARALQASGGGFQVADAAGLTARLRALFADDGVARAAGEAARAAVRERQGPFAVTMALVRGTLGMPPPRAGAAPMRGVGS